MDVVTLMQGDEDSNLTPLFLIHAVSGLALPFLRLGDISEDGSRPVYGITSHMHCPGAQHFKYPTSLSDLASIYIDEIKAVKPHGPYLLGGWSMGGMVAMFMARILEDRGEEVLKVIMIDSANPEAFPNFEDASEQRALAKVTYQRIASYALELDDDAADVPTPHEIAEDEEEDYFSVGFKKETPEWSLSRSSTSNFSSASSVFDMDASDLSNQAPASPPSTIDMESHCSDEDYDDDACFSSLEEDFDDEDDDLEMFSLDGFLQNIKLHIHQGLGLIAGVQPGELFHPGTKSNFDVALIKCAPDLEENTARFAAPERMRLLRSVTREQSMKWDYARFRNFEAIPFSGCHDGAFLPEVVDELSSILRECLETVC